MPTDQKEIEAQLLNLTREFLRELSAERALQAVTLEASLESDLGIDSLGKVELFHRLETNFAIHLPEEALVNANTLSDLVAIIQSSETKQSALIKPRTVTPTLATTSLNLAAAKTYLDVIKLRSTEEPNRPHVYLQSEKGEEQIIRYGELFAAAEKVAIGLQQRGIQPGETVAIMLPTGIDFFAAFCGVLLAGAVPVSIYPPFRADRIIEYVQREAKILRNAEARILITFSAAKTLSNMLSPFIPSLKEVTNVAILQSTSGKLTEINVNENDTILIQYTSGSTGDPKGVQLTHANFLANIRAIGQAIPIMPTDVEVSWLPLYHDMGLMSWLGALYFGVPATIMSPLSFLARPEQWLWAIHYHRATISGGPNFAYELCTKKIKLSDIQGLDLSSWRYAFSGAEAINPKTLERFYHKFAPFGFKLESFAPVYGLAEATVGLTFQKEKRAPWIDRVERDSLQKEGKAIPATHLSEKDCLEFVACGQALPQHEVRIVDDEEKLVADRIVGNIQFRGPSALQGYYNNISQTQKIFHAGWWDTGDLGYLVNQELFITGRKKDVIIKAGRNYYPEEIEEVASQVDDVRKGCVVAFGVSDPNTSTEKMIVIAETYAQTAKHRQQVQAAIIEKLAVTLGMPPDQVLLVQPKTILKTSSGKLQRSATKQAYLQGELTKKLPVKWQFVKLVVMSVVEKSVNFFRALGKVFFTAYVMILLLLTIPFAWLGVIIFSQKIAAKIVRVWLRNLLRLAFCPLKLTGKENISVSQPLIYVVNHASYIDSFVLLSLLPSGSLIVAKKEVLQMPVVRTFIKKLGFLTIDRLDFSKSIADTKQIENVARQGRALVIFPEGTFTYATGLRPFKLGAFNVAAATGLPICPIALRGTRSIMRGDKFLLRPKVVHVHVGEWVWARENNWDEVIRLHALVRAEIAKYCGEAAIDVVVAGPE